MSHSIVPRDIKMTHPFSFPVNDLPDRIVDAWNNNYPKRPIKCVRSGLRYEFDGMPLLEIDTGKTHEVHQSNSYYAAGSYPVKGYAYVTCAPSPPPFQRYVTVYVGGVSSSVASHTIQSWSAQDEERLFNIVAFL